MKEPVMLHNHSPQILSVLLSLVAGVLTPFCWLALGALNIHIPTWVISGAGAATVGFFVTLAWRALFRYLARRKVLPSILKEIDK